MRNDIHLYTRYHSIYLWRPWHFWWKHFKQSHGILGHNILNYLYHKPRNLIILQKPIGSKSKTPSVGWTVRKDLVAGIATSTYFTIIYYTIFENFNVSSLKAPILCIKDPTDPNNFECSKFSLIILLVILLTCAAFGFIFNIATYILTKRQCMSEFFSFIRLCG